MKLKRSFYLQNTIVVAKKLLGCFLVHKTIEGIIKGKIVDVEAYMGPEDKGSHSYNGRHTPRMDPLYNIGGFAYIYQLYGYNYCFNVVTQKKEIPHAILIRGLEPCQRVDLMAEHRNIDISTGIRSKFKNLTNGPSKLCQAMDIDTSLNGIDLCADKLFITSGKTFKDKEILNVPRVNIGYAKEYKDKKWRFILKNNEFISKYPKQ